MFEKIKKYILEQEMIQKEDRIILGVSGGADSVCLLFVLQKLRKEMDFELVAVHVNHGLRGENADGDEQFVRGLCKELNIPCECYLGKVELLSKKWKQSTEEAGRNFRRSCFNEALEKYQGTKIALAHHKNDSVETFFMNLARGTGLKGLGGIAPIQGNIIRPLLCVERKEIERYLDENKITYRTDETNTEDSYTRNRVRNHLIPFMEQEMNEKTVEHMDETMNYLRQLQEYLEKQAESYWNVCVNKNDGLLLIDREYDKVPAVLRPMIIKRMMATVAGREKDLESVHVKDIEDLRKKQVGRKLDLPYNMEAKRVYQGISISLKQKRQDDYDKEILYKPDIEEYFFGKYRIACKLCDREEMEKSMEKGGTKYFDYDIIKNGISFRARRTGDYITIDDAGRTQKLKSYFINEKVPQEKRDEILLIVDGSHVLSIWGFRENPAYRVTENTKSILSVRVDEGEESWQKKLVY